MSPGFFFALNRNIQYKQSYMFLSYLLDVVADRCPLLQYTYVGLAAKQT